jgi:hypothetical protein
MCASQPRLVLPPQTSENIKSRGAWHTLVDLGYRSWWFLAFKQESHTKLELLSLTQGKLLFLTTHSTIEKEGCPRWLCHLDVDGFIAPKTFFQDLASLDGSRRGYNPPSHLPWWIILFVTRSFIRKVLGWNSIRALLSDVNLWTEARLLLATGTCKYFVDATLYVGYVRLYDQCY